MNTARFNRLLASTALGLGLVLGSHAHAGMAEQSGKKIEAAVPMPDTTLPPPLTAKDIDTTSAIGSAPSAESKRDAAAPAADTAKAEPKQDAPAADAAKIEVAVPMPDTTLPPPLTAKDVATAPTAAPAGSAEINQDAQAAGG